MKHRVGSSARVSITVLLVDDHAVVREGYRRLLERSPGIAVVGEASTGADAVERSHELTPDIVVLDIALPGMSGIEAARRIRARAPDQRILVFSMYDDVIYADRALAAEVSGYVTKASAPEVLIDAVHAVARAGRYLSHDIAQKLALRRLDPARTPGQSLSSREFEILRLLVSGMPVSAVASEMGLNPKTVANHQSAIKQKLGAESPVDLIRRGEALLSGRDDG
jgi:DNA-binding NarL/FixJ family response regulator